MKPKVSILIPLYNSEKYISETIESCLNQSYKNIEVIIVDDASTDNSYQIVKQYESNIVKVYQQKKGGACRARNYAFELSSGDYIQYLDADDLLSSDKIEKQMRLLCQEKEYIISSSRWCRFYDKTTIENVEELCIYKDYIDPKEILIDMWTKRVFMQPSIWLAHRKLIQEAGIWNENLYYNDDGEFFCRVLLKAKSIFFCSEGMVYYRNTPNSMTSGKKSYEKQHSLLLSYILYEKILSVSDTFEARQALVMNYATFIYSFYSYPSLVKLAYEKISKLNVGIPNTIGYKLFKIFRKFVGFKNAISLRYIITSIKNMLSKKQSLI